MFCIRQAQINSVCGLFKEETTPPMLIGNGGDVAIVTHAYSRVDGEAWPMMLETVRVYETNGVDVGMTACFPLIYCLHTRDALTYHLSYVTHHISRTRYICHSSHIDRRWQPLSSPGVLPMQVLLL